ncbi:hypothetical protein GPU89_04880 [Burkholderia cepacia]|nr:hypothetical protein [Burkholderia cepacia]
MPIMQAMARLVWLARSTRTGGTRSLNSPQTGKAMNRGNASMKNASPGHVALCVI